MWHHDEVVKFFSLFDVQSTDIFANLGTDNIDKANVDAMSISSLEEAGVDIITGTVMLAQWRDVCSSSTDPTAALSEVQRVIDMWRAYGRKHESGDPSTSPYVSNLRAVIAEQKTRVDALERREIDYQQELAKRSELVLNLRAQMVTLEGQNDVQMAEIDKTQQLMLAGHELLQTEVTALQRKLLSLYDHMHSIDAEAQRTIGIVEKDLAYGEVNKKGDSEGSHQTDQPNLMISVRRISAHELPVQDTTTPFVTLHLKESSAETKVLPPGCPYVWDDICLELPVSSEDLRTGSLTVQVWDYQPGGRPDQVTGGIVTFPTHFSSVRAGTEFEWPVLFEDESGGSAGRVVLLVSVREHGTVQETADGKMDSLAGNGGGVSDEGVSRQDEDQANAANFLNSCANRLLEQQDMQCFAEGGVAAAFFQSWQEVLQSLAGLSVNCDRTLSASASVDRTQMTLSRLLEEAMSAHRAHCDTICTYSSSIATLRSSMESQRENTLTNNEWKVKHDNLMKVLDSTRSELQELQSIQTKVTSAYENASSQLSLEAARAESAEKQAVKLQNEVDHLIEVIRRDMAERITRKSANDELAALSSLLVARGEKVNSGRTGNRVAGDTVAPAAANDEDKEVYHHAHDWNLLLSRVRSNMSDIDVAETKLALIHIKKSFDIMSSRLYLEIRARSSAEMKLDETRDDLSAIKKEVQGEIKKRDQLEEDLRTAREEAEREAENAFHAKTAARDAIRQAQYFQKKMNREIDHLRWPQTARYSANGDEGSLETVSEARTDTAAMEGRRTAGASSPYASRKSMGPGKRDVMDDYFDNLHVTPDRSPAKRGGRNGAGMKLSSQSTGPVLQTRSESNIDRKRRAAQVIQKKNKGNGSRFSMPGRGLFKSRSKGKRDSKGAVAPMDYADRPEWIDANHKDYRYRASFTSSSPGN